MRSTFIAEIEFDAVCHVCNSDLETDTTKVKGVDIVIVKPCEICLRAAKDKAYDEGYHDAAEEA